MPIVGHGCAGKTELALRVATDACVEAVSQLHELTEEPVPSFDVLWISVGDLFPIQRFVHMVETEYGIYYSTTLSKLESLSINGTKVTEEEYFLRWMQNVTTRCHVIECLEWKDVQIVLREIISSQHFSLDPSKVPLVFVDCGPLIIPRALQSLVLPMGKSFPHVKWNAHPFARIIRHLFPDVLNKFNGCGVVIFRCDVKCTIEDVQNSNQNASSLNSLQVLFQGDDQVLFQVRGCIDKNYGDVSEKNPSTARSQQVSFEITPDAGFSVCHTRDIATEH